ncbi:hypothetical protein [Microbacterium sp. GXF0217]
MLRRTVFATRGFGALNPTAVFGNDRAAYITALEAADTLSDEGTIAWASFFARGIREDITRLIHLQDRDYVIDALIGPALTRLARDGRISDGEHRVLNEVLQRGTVKAGDLAQAAPGSASYRSRLIRQLDALGFLPRMLSDD